MKGKNYIKMLLPLIALDGEAAYLIYYTVHLGNLPPYDDWTAYNLSVVCFWSGHEMELLIWGIITAVVFVGFLLYIRFLSGEKLAGVAVAAVLAGAFLVVGVNIPYQQEAKDSLCSNAHIACSLNAPLCLAGGLIAVTVRMLRRGVKSMVFMSIFLVAGLSGAALLVVKYGIITTTLEVYTITALAFYMTVMALILLNRRYNRDNLTKN